jgi:hypothetical protein
MKEENQLTKDAALTLIRQKCIEANPEIFHCSRADMTET